MCPQARLDKGLDFFSIDRLSTVRIPRLAYGILKSHRHIERDYVTYLHDLPGGVIEPDEPLPAITLPAPLNAAM